MKTLICNCNRTMTLDAPALRRALAGVPGASAEGLETVHELLCRREAPAFQRAAKAAVGEELLVACTQESRLFVELNEQTEGAPSVAERPIRFVNIRETAGWSREAAPAAPNARAAAATTGLGPSPATPKMAALIAAAQLPAPEPVGTVGYRSAGSCLVVGEAAAAEQAVQMLGDGIDASVLATGGPIGQRHGHAVHAGRLVRLTGWLGAFDAHWEASNPIDLDLCTRCNACVRACPEGAIGLGYQIDLDACRGHRACVEACGAAGAIDFNRAPQPVSERFDLVLDLRAEPAFAMHQPPQGYQHVADAADAQALARAVATLRGLVGEFEKPKFFAYQERLCAHSRNERIGCRACIDVCSAEAIRSDASLRGKARGKGPAVAGAPTGGSGGGVVVEPHLCVGCGACSTVCPSGAMTFAYPAAPDIGRRIRTLLQAYALAGGTEAALLLHSEAAGARVLDALGRAARVDRALHGLPPRVLPLALWHTASVGIEVWLTAIAHGASQVWVLLSGEEAPEYRRALGEQMAVAQALLTGLGYGEGHLRLVQAAPAAAGSDGPDLAALDAALRQAPARGVKQAATFAVQPGKRATLELVVDHLAAQAPSPAPGDTVELPAGAPFGSLVVDTGRCTMCLSCVGACPSSALADNPDQPQLRFVEKNCVQCGLCATTCPEQAITLQPRLWLADGGRARKAMRVLHEMPPFACVRCGKPFGTLRAIEAMVAKLAGHSAFQGRNAERLKMCGDCRVIDLHTDPGEVRIHDL